MDILLFIIGFIILVKGAGWLIKGSSTLARFFGMSEWLIGITIVGIGTSIPEMSVTVFSAISGNADIGVGTIIGSNTLNILFILGLCALFAPTVIEQHWVKRDFVFNLLAVCAAFVLAATSITSNYLILGRFDGALLLLLFISWLVYEIKRQNHQPNLKTTENYKSNVLPISFLLVLGGLVGVIVGAEWVVDGAVKIAEYFNASDGLIGLTIIGIGTSLPELVVSVTAAIKKNFGMSVGNIVGSNIFDFLGILGIASFINPISVSPYLAADFTVTVLACLMLIYTMFIGKKYTLTRAKGMVYIFTYTAYMLFILYRG